MQAIYRKMQRESFGRCCADLQNVQITTAGNRLLAARPAPPAAAEAVLV